MGIFNKNQKDDFDDPFDDDFDNDALDDESLDDSLDDEDDLDDLLDEDDEGLFDEYEDDEGYEPENAYLNEPSSQEDYTEDSEYDEDIDNAEDEEEEKNGLPGVLKGAMIVLIVALSGFIIFNIFSGDDEDGADNNAVTGTSESVETSKSEEPAETASSSSSTQTTKSTLDDTNKSSQAAANTFLKSFYVDRNASGAAKIFDKEKNVTPQKMQEQIDTFKGNNVTTSIEPKGENVNVGTVFYENNGKKYKILVEIECKKQQDGSWRVYNLTPLNS